MGLGSTAKKIQIISDKAEQMYKQVQELQSRIIHLEEEVDATHDTVERLDGQMTEQRALLKVMAEQQGIDAEAILAEAAIDEAETGEVTDDRAAGTNESRASEGAAWEPTDDEAATNRPNNRRTDRSSGR